MVWPAIAELQPQPAPRPRQVLPRGLAMFLGGFALLNILGDLRFPHFNATLWWIDLRALPLVPVTLFLLVSSVCLIAFAVWPSGSAWRRWLTCGCAGMLCVAAVVNAMQFYVLSLRGAVRPGIPLPLSFFVAGALATVCLAARHSPEPLRGARGLVRVMGVAFACLLLFAVAQMFFFGKTDYRRPADAAVVLGARVYADGRLSDALADRVRTACQLYREGLVRKLIFSGGPGDGAIHETEAMKRVAISLGVSAEDIWLDKAGVSTQATVRNTGALFRQWHASRILVVSHAYHLPRIKLAYQRDGWDVFTVPARESYFLRQMPYNMAREVAALWVYYLRPLVAA